MKKIISYAPYYVVCIGLAGAFWSRPVFLMAAYVSLSVVMLLRWHEIDDLTFYAVPFILGPVGEVVGIYYGAWQYAKPLALIPVWLPFAWGCAGLYMKKTSEALVTLRKGRSLPDVIISPEQITVPAREAA